MLFPSVTCGQTALWRPHCGVECVHVVDMAASCNICVSAPQTTSMSSYCARIMLYILYNVR